MGFEKMDNKEKDLQVRQSGSLEVLRHSEGRSIVTQERQGGKRGRIVRKWICRLRRVKVAVLLDWIIIKDRIKKSVIQKRILRIC